jgi:hypothetical protein
MILFGIFLILIFVVGLVYYLILMPADPFIWFIIGAVLGIVLALGIIMIAEGRHERLLS